MMEMGNAREGEEGRSGEGRIEGRVVIETILGSEYT